MNYLGASAMYSPMGATQASSEVDLIRTWQAVKANMFRSQGAYQKVNPATGQLAYVMAPGSITIQPHVTRKQADALYSAWLRIGSRMVEKLHGDERSAQAVIDTMRDYQGEYQSWRAWAEDRWYASGYTGYRPSTGGGPYLYLDVADRFFKITGEYARDLNTAVWVGYNTGDAYDDMIWALDNTTGGYAIKPWFVVGAKANEAVDYIKRVAPGVLNDALEGFLSIGKIIKWGAYAGVGYAGWILYKTLAGKRS